MLNTKNTHFSAVVVGSVRGCTPAILACYYFYIDQLGCDRVCLKLPGGSSKEGETPKDTAMRELFEETGLVCGLDDLYEVHSQQKLMDEGGSGKHVQYFFALDMRRTSGTLRMGDPMPETQIGKYINPPEWCEIDRGLLREIYYSHLKGTKKGVIRLARLYEDFFWISCKLGLICQDR